MASFGSSIVSNSRSYSCPVIVNVYNMSWLNEYIGSIGLGVYHTGVEVYGQEYCYGGHHLGGSGIFEMSPHDTENLGSNYSFKTSIAMGFTDFTYRDVRTILSTMEEDFRGTHYHLLRKNCNHFSSAFVEILCGASLPKWINRLAVVSTKLPFIEKSIPKEWLTPLQQIDQGPLKSSRREHPHANGFRRSNIEASSSNTPSRSNTAPAAFSSPSEQWHRFQSQVSNYFSRGNGGGSSSTSMSTSPPT